VKSPLRFSARKSIKKRKSSAPHFFKPQYQTLSPDRGWLINLWVNAPTVLTVPCRWSSHPPWFMGLFSVPIFVTNTRVQAFFVGNLINGVNCPIFWDKWPVRVNDPNVFNRSLLAYGDPMAFFESGFLTYTGDPRVFFHNVMEALSRGVPLSTFINESDMR